MFRGRMGPDYIVHNLFTFISWAVARSASCRHSRGERSTWHPPFALRVLRGIGLRQSLPTLSCRMNYKVPRKVQSGAATT